jgi:hypothetical protein
MGGRFRAGIAVTLISSAIGLGFLSWSLLRQGLERASLWATFLVLPLTVISTAAAVWAVTAAARTSGYGQDATQRSPARREPAQSGVTMSGSIHQESTGGTTVAHTGVGDIVMGAAETVERSDESG